MTKQRTLSDQLRAAIEGSELSQYAVAKNAGIQHAVMSRFMTGKGGLSLEGIDAVGLLLGLNLVAEGKPKPAKPRRTKGK